MPPVPIRTSPSIPVTGTVSSVRLTRNRNRPSAPRRTVSSTDPRTSAGSSLPTPWLQQPGQQRGQPVDTEPGGDVRGRTVTGRAPGDRGASGVHPGAVVRQHLGVAVGDGDPVGPQTARGGVVQFHRLPGEQRAELLDADAEQVAQGTRVSAEPDVVVLVDDPGEVRGDEVAAPLGVAREVLGQFGRHHVQHGRDQHLVPGEVGAGGDEVGADTEGEQRGVPVERLLPVVQQGGGVGVLLTGPPRLPVVEDADGCRLPLRTRHRGKGLQRGAEGGDRAEQVAVLAERAGPSPSGTSRRRPPTAATGRSTPRPRRAPRAAASHGPGRRAASPRSRAAS